MLYRIFFTFLAVDIFLPFDLKGFKFIIISRYKKNPVSNSVIDIVFGYYFNSFFPHLFHK